MKGRDGSTERGTLCGTALVFAEEIHRRVAVNRESSRQVSRSLGITDKQLHSVLRLCKRGIPSLERRAVTCMRAPDISDADIAEWFGKPKEWAESVRRNMQAIKQREFIPKHLDYVADEWEPGDPSPLEIARMCAEIRSKPPVGMDRVRGVGNIRVFAWQGGRRGSFLPLGS